MLVPLLILCTAPLTPISFTYVSAAAQDVRYAGDFFGWQSPQPMKKSGGKWSIAIDAPLDTRLEYKFVVDGQWILDPANPRKNDNGVGGENSVYLGPKYVFHGLEKRPKRPMRRAELAVGGRQIIIFSPPIATGMPVLVYGDGPNYEKYGKVQNVVQNLVEQGRIRPAVIVLVPPVDRMKEYGAGWREYAAFLFDQVLPAARKATGASAAAKDLYVGGSSMGGLIALRLAEEFPEKVGGGVHSQSGAFVQIQGREFGQVATTAGFSKLAPMARLWLCWGAFEGDLTKANENAAKTLAAMKRPFASKVTNEGHTWTSWRNRMAEALEYLLKP